MDGKASAKETKVIYARVKKAKKSIIIIACIVIISVIGLYLLLSKNKSQEALKSPQWIEQNCHLSAFVDVGTGYPNAQQSGITVLSKKSLVTSKEPSITYTWHLSGGEKFCGIVGTWYGPKEKTLKPTILSAYSGKYVDKSIKSKVSSDVMSGFTVYAKPANQ